jgi:hypothetical protein
VSPRPARYQGQQQPRIKKENAEEEKIIIRKRKALSEDYKRGKKSELIGDRYEFGRIVSAGMIGIVYLARDD